MSPPASRNLHIRYRRPPDQVEVFRQELLVDREDVKVTLARRIRRESPVVVGGRRILEKGSDVVWFSFPGVWHDVGRFHRASGRFTGLYGNVVTPPTFPDPGVLETTDLFLDLWWPVGGEPRLVDEEELAEAESVGWVTPDQADRAREEGARLLELARRGAWPPAIVAEWTRERALSLRRC